MTRERKENPPLLSENTTGNIEDSPDAINNREVIGERARTAQASPLYHSTPLSLPLDDRDSIGKGTRTAQAPPPLIPPPLSLPLDDRDSIVSGSDTSCSLDGEGHCITCSDEAVQVRVVSVNEENGLALVTVDGVEEEVDVTLVEQIAPGDLLLVHGGVAIGYVDEESNA